MKRPLCIDLYAGLGGWTEGFLAEGYRVVGFDIERHRYPARAVPPSDGVKAGNIVWDRSRPDYKGETFHQKNEQALRASPLMSGYAEYPAQLVIQDVLTLHGSQFRDAAVIVASPPCQAYSYMAMPWSRAKAMAADIRQSTAKLLELNRLFWACLDIQEQASRAAGRHIPLVIENVKGAQPWVGPAKAHFGSFYLWGDVESVGGRVIVRPEFGQGIAAARGGKNNGGSWFGVAHNTESGVGQNPVTGVKQRGSGPEWFDKALDERRKAATYGVGFAWDGTPLRAGNSKSDSRKAASAMIAKIPPDLARFIARSFYPTNSSEYLQSRATRA
jgi:hypothetical protein